MKLIGVYAVDDYPNVHLVEMIFDMPPAKVDVGQITQEVEGQTRSNWQVPWDEKYLDDAGEEIIGEFFEIPEDGDTTRLIFFFHDLDFSKPLITASGEVALSKPISIPDRLKDKLEYESPD